jgi:hypothetical protein
MIPSIRPKTMLMPLFQRWKTSKEIAIDRGRMIRAVKMQIFSHDSIGSSDGISDESERPGQKLFDIGTSTDNVVGLLQVDDIINSAIAIEESYPKTQAP